MQRLHLADGLERNGAESGHRSQGVAVFVQPWNLLSRKSGKNQSSDAAMHIQRRRHGRSFGIGDGSLPAGAFRQYRQLRRSTTRAQFGGIPPQPHSAAMARGQITDEAQ